MRGSGSLRCATNSDFVILPLTEGLREAAEFLLQFTVHYPNEALVRLAIRGCAECQLRRFDAYLWVTRVEEVGPRRKLRNGAILAG